MPPFAEAAPARNQAGTAVLSVPPPARPFGGYDLAFWALLFAFELFLFTLPLFPNGDGPMHIYLSTILWKVATHSSPLYEHFYAVRHLIQPYSFHYYFLILLEHVMTPDTAEKCFVGLIWATEALGFRVLGRALAKTPGAGASAASLLVFPFLIGWPVLAGFLNFSFGIGLLLCALSSYTRLGGPAPPRRSLALFVFTLVLLILAHPIPLMILIFLTGADLTLQALPGLLRERRLRFPPRQALTFTLACVAFVFPILIADKSTVSSAASHLHPHLHYLLPMLEGFYISGFQVRNLLGGFYQGLLMATLPLSLFLFFRARLRTRLRGGLTAGDRLLLCTLLYLAAAFCLPEDMNGSSLFAVRMWYVVWFLASACVAPLVETSLPRRGVAALGGGLGLLALFFGLLYLRPVARQQAEFEQAPLPPHARGIFIQPMNTTHGVGTHTWWGLNWWGGMRAFSAHDDVLVNTPWMQLTIVPVGENGRAGLLRDITPNLVSESPALTLELLGKTPEKKPAALALADFLLFADPNSPAPNPLGLASGFLGPYGTGWGCAAHGFYAICTRKPS